MTIGALMCPILLVWFVTKRPLVPGQEPIGPREYRRAERSWHGWAWLGALIWSTGTVSNLVVAYQPDFSVAIAYTLGQCAPVVAAVWGIFLWKEFGGGRQREFTCVCWACSPCLLLGYCLSAWPSVRILGMNAFQDHKNFRAPEPGSSQAFPHSTSGKVLAFFPHSV